jgi:hypothetical protein
MGSEFFFECSMAGRYDNPIPTRCLAPIDFLKIPALMAIVSILNEIESSQESVYPEFLNFYRAQE